MTKRILLLHIAIIILVGCGSQDHRATKKVFDFNIHAGFTSMDPAFSRNQANIWVCNQLFNGLVSLDSNLNVQPAIAHSWEIDSAGTTYTFHLRRDVFFHEHELFKSKEERKVKAFDFVYSFKRIVKPETASPGAWIFNNKVEKKNGEFQFLAPNDSTFQIKLKAPFAPFLGLLSMKFCSVVSAKVVEHFGKDFRKNAIGTGPFKMAYYYENEKLILHQNSEYFESGEDEKIPKLDAVSISFLPSKQSEFLSFLKGELDFLSGIDGSFKDNILTQDGQLKERYKGDFIMEKTPYLNTEYLGILMENQEFKPLQKKKIRQAINFGFDRKKMIKYLRNNIGRPAHYGFVPRGLPAFSDTISPKYTYRPEKVKSLLAKAGFSKQNPVPKITLLTNQSYLDFCVYISKSLNDLGIPIEVEVVAPSLLREMMAKGDASFFRGSWIADYPDAENYLALFYSKNQAPSGPNYTHYSNPLFDSLYEKARMTSDSKKRLKLYHKMSSIIQDESPVIPLYYDEIIRLKQPNVKGLTGNAVNLLDLRRVDIQ